MSKKLLTKQPKQMKTEQNSFFGGSLNGLKDQLKEEREPAPEEGQKRTIELEEEPGAEFDQSEEPIPASETDEETFLLLWEQLDAWRATGAAMVTGESPDRYRMAKDAREDEALRRAGGRMVAKYKFLKGSNEWIIAASLLLGTLAVVQRARKDLKKADENPTGGKEPARTGKVVGLKKDLGI